MSYLIRRVLAKPRLILDEMCRLYGKFASYLRRVLRKNGPIVGQQLPTMLDVTCFVRLHTLLYVVACCCAKFETGQTFQPTTPNISFVP